MILVGASVSVGQGAAVSLSRSVGSVAALWTSVLLLLVAEVRSRCRLVLGFGVGCSRAGFRSTDLVLMFVGAILVFG